MSGKYYRGLRNILNDTKHKLQLASMNLKINENKNSISGIKNDISGINNFSDKIDTNTSSISSNLGKINTNTLSISTNSGKIDTNESNISSNLGKINDIKNDLVDFTRHYSIENIYVHNITLEKEFTLNSSNPEQHVFTYNIEDDFKIDSYLEVNTNILYDYKSYSSIGRLSQIFRFYDEKNTLLDEIKLAKTNSGDNLYENLSEKNIFYIKINHNCSTISIKLFIGFLHKTSSDIIVKIINPLKSNYLWVKYYKKIKKLSIDNDLSDLESNISSNKGLIETNKSSISSNKGLISTNTSDIAGNSGLISTNTSDISDNSGLISMNTGSIASNLLKINKNTDDITALQTSNIKAFYNLDQIFIYDIEKGNQTVDKDNHFHIFEKEITYNFIKNSYLEIALKVLTEISNYVLIGFFQILCNFYDQDNNLFYTISLSTAMGSINKLSTIKSVFIVPINEHMSKIKIDFFIAPKETQQNRSARFTIQDINSNKIYVKYFQKTDEMSIKDIRDSLDNLEKSIYLKNLFNELYHKVDIKVSHIFFDKTFLVNAKRNDFLEVYFKMLLKYDDISNAKYVTANFILYDMSNGQELYSVSYRNSDYIGITNIDVFLNNSFLFNFDNDVNKLKIGITFSVSRTGLNIIYSSINTNRLILKHYGN